MKKPDTFHKVFGGLFIVVGVTLYVTPIPGTTLLIILGFVWLMGKNRTSYFLKKLLGKKVSEFFIK